MSEYIKIIFASIGAGIGYFLGGVDGIMITLIAFIIVDYMTGVFVAVSKHKLSSDVGFKGIFKKVVILALVGIANLIDLHVIHSGAVARTAVIFFYLANEGISIIENAAKLGLPVPEKLVKILDQIKEEGGPENDNQSVSNKRGKKRSE